MTSAQRPEAGADRAGRSLHPSGPAAMGSAASSSPRGSRAVSERASLSRAATAPDPAPGCGSAFQIHHPGVAGPHQRRVPVPSGAVPQVSAGGPPRNRAYRPVPGPARGAAANGRVQAVACGVAAEPRRGTPTGRRGERGQPRSAVGVGAAGWTGHVRGDSPALRGPLLPGQLRKGGGVEAGAFGTSVRLKIHSVSWEPVCGGVISVYQEKTRANSVAQSVEEATSHVCLFVCGVNAKINKTPASCG